VENVQTSQYPEVGVVLSHSPEFNHFNGVSLLCGEIDTIDSDCKTDHGWQVNYEHHVFGEKELIGVS
jgi:hypothetical protein